MTRSSRILLLLGGLALLAGLALWLHGAPVPSVTHDQPASAAPVTSGNKMIGTSAIGHGGPTAPPTAGPAAAMPGAGLKARKGNEG